MQPPLVWEGRFLERESVSHELHRFWRYVTTLFLFFPSPDLKKKKKNLKIWKFHRRVLSFTHGTKLTSPGRGFSCPASLSPNQVRAPS